jgi:hypothetical protein
LLTISVWPPLLGMHRKLIWKRYCLPFRNLPAVKKVKALSQEL